MERAHERQGHLDNYITDYMLLCFSYYHSEPLDRWAETMDIRRHAGWADVRERPQTAVSTEPSTEGLSFTQCTSTFDRSQITFRQQASPRKKKKKSAMQSRPHTRNRNSTSRWEQFRYNKK